MGRTGGKEEAGEKEEEEEEKIKMSGLQREEAPRKGQPSPWAGKFWVKGRVNQVGTEGTLTLCIITVHDSTQTVSTGTMLLVKPQNCRIPQLQSRLTSG